MMDKIRAKNVAYEYLCHLEEAKIWLEAVLNESLPTTSELEENLRNGVLLAKIAHLVCPENVPKNKIYDYEQRRYKMVGLQFRHTDNIAHFLKALDAISLPKIFHPETTDIFDKKNIPRVIYCIHALSTHLFKLGKAPLILDLYGKVDFSDEQINLMSEDLKRCCLQMPSFQKIGGLMANDLKGDSNLLHSNVVAINEAIESMDYQSLKRVLKNSSSQLNNVEDNLLKEYLHILLEAKIIKAEAAVNKSQNDSYIADFFDDKLTHAEIQGHISLTNVNYVMQEIQKAVEKKSLDHLLKILLKPCLELENVKSENIEFYFQEIPSLNQNNNNNFDFNKVINQVIKNGNDAALVQYKVSEGINSIIIALKIDDYNSFLVALDNPILNLNYSKFATPLYFKEMKNLLNTQETWTIGDIHDPLEILTVIARVTEAVDSDNPDTTWEALNHPDLIIPNIDETLKIQYWHVLSSCRKRKLLDRSPCSLLTCLDIHNCITSVNKNCEESNQVLILLEKLNRAVQNENQLEIISILKNSNFKLNTVTDEDAPLYLTLLQRTLERKTVFGQEAELWIEDVKSAIELAHQEIYDAMRVTNWLAELHLSLDNQDIKSLKKLLISIGIDTKRIQNYLNGLTICSDSKKKAFTCPWVPYLTEGGIKSYLNINELYCKWTKPERFDKHSIFLSKSEVKNIIAKVDSTNHNSSDYQWLIQFQARARGYLVRQNILYRNEMASKIQNWWKHCIQKRKLLINLTQRTLDRIEKKNSPKNITEKYQKFEPIIIRIQALWRGRCQRRVFSQLFESPAPPFAIVCKFAPRVNVAAENYRQEMELHQVNAQVVQTIRRNRQLSQQLDAMDIKIGLLVQNRIAVHEVLAHRKGLNDLSSTTTSISTSTSTLPGLKSLTRGARQRLDAYQHLFYALQTEPRYLSKLIFCLPSTRSKFVQSVIFSIFNFGANPREEYLLLKLLTTSLQEEIQTNFQKPSDAVTSKSEVLRLAINYARHNAGHDSLRLLLGPLIKSVLDDRDLYIETNPIMIYKFWRNALETNSGNIIDMPISVSNEQALSHSEVRERLATNLHILQNLTRTFLERITSNRELIPYGLLYMARVLRETLHEKFPKTPDKELLKVVGNILYYQYINSAIVTPDVFDIIQLDPNQWLSSQQRSNLASIAKILHFAATKKGFGEESAHLKCLNYFIVECHEKFKAFFRYCCTISDLEDHYSMHRYSDATLLVHPSIYISIQEIHEMHQLILQYRDDISPDPLDPLHELLDELNSKAPIDPLLTKYCNANSIDTFSKTEICLTLVNKFDISNEEDINTAKKLFIKTKGIILLMLPCLSGDNLAESLSTTATSEQEEFYIELTGGEGSQVMSSPNISICTTWSGSLSIAKRQVKHQLDQLEHAGLVSKKDGYQSIVTAIAHDICHQLKIRESRAKELAAAKATKLRLDEKTKFHEEQIKYYNEYINTCLENLNSGKRSIHRKRSSHKTLGKLRAKRAIKYSANKLREKGILLEVQGFIPIQYKSLQFEITPTDSSGLFTVCGLYMGIEMDKVEIDIQDLLQLQFEGATVMNLFDKAKVNVNLLLFLLNKKFFGLLK